MSDGLTPLLTKKMIGHEAARAALEQGLFGGDGAINIRHHAWLLSGPRGVGKATLALAMTKKLLMMEEEGVAMVPKDNLTVEPVQAAQEKEAVGMPDLFGGFDDMPIKPPGKKAMAEMSLVEKEAQAGPTVAGALAEDREETLTRQLLEQYHPNFLFLDKDGEEEERKDSKKTQITVGMVRRIDDFLSLHGFDKKLPRVVVIDAAEEMNNAAANALLKNLEEPPSGTVFFLTCHRLGLLPATIRSRCLRLNLKPLTRLEVEKIIATEVPLMGEEERGALAILARGAAGRALELYRGAGLNMYRDWLDFCNLFASGEANKKEAMKRKILAAVMPQERGGQARLLTSLIEEFFLRLAIYANGITLDDSNRDHSNNGRSNNAMHGRGMIFEQEQKIFDVFLAQGSLRRWLDFWQRQEEMLTLGFPVKNLNRDYLLMQLLDETAEQLLRA